MIEGLDAAIKKLPIKEKANIIIAPEKGFGEKPAKEGKIPARSHLVYLNMTILRKGVRGETAGEIVNKFKADDDDDLDAPKAQTGFIVVRYVTLALSLLFVFPILTPIFHTIVVPADIHNDS